MIEKGGFGEVLLKRSNYWRSLQKPFISIYIWKLHNNLNPKIPLKVGTNIDALLRGRERNTTQYICMQLIIYFTFK